MTDMFPNLRFEHLRFYSLLTRLPNLIISYASGFKIPPKPLMMVWEATYRCPAHCTSCNRWQMGKRDMELTTFEAEELIDDAFALGVRLLVVSGGDPLMRPDVIKLGAHAKSRGMLTVLCTTGALINKRNVRAVMDSYDVFELSLDSLDSNLHDELRGKSGMFDRTMRALELLLTHRHSRHGIELTTVVRDVNYQEVGEINRHFTPLGIVTAMQPLHQGIYGASTPDCFNWALGFEDAWNKMADDYQWYDAFSKLALEDFFRQIPAFLREPDQLREKYICTAGSYSFFVGPNGDLYVCDVLRRAVGNIHEKPLKHIWLGLSPLRQQISSKRRKCNCWLLCTTPPSLVLNRFLKHTPSLVRTTPTTNESEVWPVMDEAQRD